MSSYYSHYRSSPHDYLTPGVRSLMIVMVVAFIMSAIASKSAQNVIEYYFALTPNKLLNDFFLWQLVTYSFLHDPWGLTTLFFNLLTLFFLGHIVERHYGTQKFYICYLCCAVFAGIVHTIHIYLFQNPNLSVVGPSPAITGILTVAACLIPHATVYFMFFIPMKMRTLIWIIIGINLYWAYMLPPGYNVSATGHLGGIGCGYVFFRYSRRVMGWLDTMEKKIQKQQEKEQEKKYKNMRGKVDNLLDKINHQGIHSLTDKEKEFLKKASKDYRNE